MWFCSFEGKSYGPFSEHELRRFISERPESLVWKNGMPEWIPAHDFEQMSASQQVFPASVLKTDLDFKICGSDMQYVEFALKPGETILAEPGSMIYKQINVEFEARMGNGQKQGFFRKLFGAGKRILTGESFFLASFTNKRADKKQRVAFAAPYPGKIIPVSLNSFGHEIICQKDSFLCAESDVSIGVFFQKRILTALFGGAGFIMQRLYGDGLVFINAGGSIAEYDLKPGEVIEVDVGCLVAFQPGVTFDITDAGTVKSQFLGGSGLFFAELTGPGKVWVQSLPFSRLARRIFQTPAGQRALKKSP